MPASTTPMMLVQVYSETPINGARMRPATSSRMSVQQLETKTTRYAMARGTAPRLVGQVVGFARSPWQDPRDEPRAGDLGNCARAGADQRWARGAHRGGDWRRQFRARVARRGHPGRW